MALDSLPRWLRDFIELNDELAGRETGRMKRFGASDEDEGSGGRGRKKPRRLDDLLRLLQNPAYAQLYREAVETIERVDAAADLVKRKLTREGEIAAERLNRLKTNAAELPDGRKVFRTKDGRLVAEDGTDVSDKKGAVNELSLAMSSWEEFRAAQERLDGIGLQQREIDDYMRDVIDPARNRLSDPDNPMTADELRQLQRTVEENMPSALRAQVSDMRMETGTTAHTASAVAASKYVGPAGLNAPDLSAQFEAASPVLTDDAFAPPAPDSPADSETAITREPFGSQAASLPARTPKT